VDQGVQIAQGRGILIGSWAENALGEGGLVEVTAAVNSGAKARNYGFSQRKIVNVALLGCVIGIKNGRSKRLEDARHRALTRANAAGQADDGWQTERKLAWAFHDANLE
jgi:hypothetical protein